MKSFILIQKSLIKNSRSHNVLILHLPVCYVGLEILVCKFNFKHRIQNYISFKQPYWSNLKYLQSIAILFSIQIMHEHIL